MNSLLTAIAASILPDALVKTLANQEIGNALSEGDKNIVNVLVDQYSNVDNNATRALATVLNAMDPKFKGIYAEFLVKIGASTPTGRFEAFTVLTSVSAAHHPIPRGESFFVIHGKNRHCLKQDGDMVQYDERDRSSRVATKEEVEKYFSALTTKHLSTFVANDLLASYVERATSNLVLINTADVDKSSRAKKKDIVLAPLSPVLA